MTADADVPDDDPEESSPWKDGPLWSTAKDEKWDPKACWRTPNEVFRPLHREFRFTLDVAARHGTALVPWWLGPDHSNPARRDAFESDWRTARGPMPEVWRNIEGWPGYLVSDHGRIRGSQGGILVGSLDKDGYRRVTLVRHLNGNREQYCQKVASAVAAAFIGPRPDGLVTRHLNSDHSDNGAWNLAYGTIQRNIDDRDAAGNTPRGERHWKTSLTEDQAFQIRGLNGQLAAQVVANQFAVSVAVVQNIWTGRSWGPAPEKRPPELSSYSPPGAAWANPPYGRNVGRWVRLCRRWGAVMPVVLLVMARLETPWFHGDVLPYAAEVRAIRRRVKYLRMDGTRLSGAPAPSILIVYRPGHQGECRLSSFDPAVLASIQAAARSRLPRSRLAGSATETHGRPAGTATARMRGSRSSSA